MAGKLIFEDNEATKIGVMVQLAPGSNTTVEMRRNKLSEIGKIWQEGSGDDPEMVTALAELKSLMPTGVTLNQKMITDAISDPALATAPDATAQVEQLKTTSIGSFLSSAANWATIASTLVTIAQLAGFLPKL